MLRPGGSGTECREAEQTTSHRSVKGTGMRQSRAVSQAVLWKMAGNGCTSCYGLRMQRQRFWPVEHSKSVETQGGDEIKSILNTAGGFNLGKGTCVPKIMEMIPSSEESLTGMGAKSTVSAVMTWVPRKFLDGNLPLQKSRMAI